MVAEGEVELRRTWPQRLVLLACLGVIAGAGVAAWFVQTLYDGLAEVPRIQISRDVLFTDTVPGEPVNFLLVGTDSAEGIDPDDPINIGRIVDPRGRHNADSISILRLDPRSGQAWVMSIPRDLYVDIPDAAPNTINATLLIGGPELLIRTVSETFDIQINHYVVLDFLGFREVVDQLGGVPVWFEHEARSEATGLSILSPGCHVLDGVQALQYVRARDYQEFIDGEWTTIGNSDFGRIERQQDFLVLTIDRAIQRGARSPRTLASLVESGAQSVELDQGLTVKELADLGRSFSSFDPESLARFTPEVDTVFRGNDYLGEVLVTPETNPERGQRNEDMYTILRGEADGVDPADVTFDLYATDEADLEGDGELLAGAAIGFRVGERRPIEGVEESVVIHPPGGRADAILVARHLEPIPALVEDEAATGLSVVLGEEHEQVLFFVPHPFDEAIDAIDERDDVGAPDLGTAGDPSAEGAIGTVATTTVAPSGDVDQEPAPAVATIQGRPPEGESCG